MYLRLFLITFHDFLFILLAALSEPGFGPFFLLRRLLGNLNFDLLCVLFGFQILIFAHILLERTFTNLFNVLIEIHFESRRQGLRLWHLLLFLHFRPPRSKCIVLVDSVGAIAELHLVDFLGQVE